MNQIDALVEKTILLSKEFEFIRDKLEKIARLLTAGAENNVTEIAFMIGCLHSICHQNSIDCCVHADFERTPK